MACLLFPRPPHRANVLQQPKSSDSAQLHVIKRRRGRWKKSRGIPLAKNKNSRHRRRVSDSTDASKCGRSPTCRPLCKFVEEDEKVTSAFRMQIICEAATFALWGRRSQLPDASDGRYSRAGNAFSSQCGYSWDQRFFQGQAALISQDTHAQTHTHTSRHIFIFRDPGGHWGTSSWAGTDLVRVPG